MPGRVIAGGERSSASCIRRPRRAAAGAPAEQQLAHRSGIAGDTDILRHVGHAPAARRASPSQRASSPARIRSSVLLPTPLTPRARHACRRTTRKDTSLNRSSPGCA